MMFARFIFILAFILATGRYTLAGGHQELGKVEFANSCAERVQPQLQRAVALLHSFWWEKAEAGFREVLDQDPSCTIAVWGIATVKIGNPFSSGPSPADAQTSADVFAIRTQFAAKTEREGDYLKAVGAYYDLYPGKPHRVRLRALSDAFEALAAKYRDDDEAQIFLGLYLAATQPPFDKSLDRAKQAILILNEQFAKHPDHPGVAHYLIHANDFPALAEHGLYAATCYSNIAPTSPHALHMPSHIFTRVGLWQQSAEANQRSRDAAKLAGIITEQLHAYDYWVYADLQLARDSEARQIVVLGSQLSEKNRAADYARAAIPARFAVERGQWKEAAQLPEPDRSEYPYTSAIRYFARALGAARSGDPGAAEREVSHLRDARDAMAAAQDDYWAAEIAVQELAAQAWIAQAHGDHDGALELMRAAANKEDLSEKSSISPGRLLPARELLGDMLLEDRHPAEALKAYEASEKRDPKRFRTSWGAAQAAAASGNTETAKLYYTMLLGMAGSGDSRPELVAARAWLSTH
ncbi:MAG: hypothetical protein WBX25_03740 [Rhodomicrobium sp.]